VVFIYRYIFMATPSRKNLHESIVHASASLVLVYNWYPATGKL
jgi:hypothetical protein